jgi:PPOX class probable F420-dependent enzyme
VTVTLEPEAHRLFAGPHFVHLTTLRADGSPQARPVWTIVHDGDVVFFTQPQSAKARDLARDPRVALSVTDHDNPYASAWIRGRVARTIEGDDALAIIDEISHVYTGAPFPMRSGVVYVVEAQAAGHATLPFKHEPPAG